MPPPTKIPLRQLDIGPAGHFLVNPEDPPGNQVVVEPGFLYVGANSIVDAFSGGSQTTASFGPVGSGDQRYDLVYLDNSGSALIEVGTAVALGSGVYVGAPGFSGGPALPDSVVPLAYVFVDETAGVEVDADDITLLGGQRQAERDLDGYLIDFGLLGAAPSGSSDDVSALFAAESPGGGAMSPGVVTAAPLNYVHLVDQAGDEILHTSGARVYGRMTEAAGTWTLSYYYLDNTGTETALGDISDGGQVSNVPTDLRLVGVPQVFSRNDPTRPLFDSAVARQSDQIVGDIPLATETSPGKVQLAADEDTASGEAVQGDDVRLGRVKGSKRASTSGANLGTGTLSAYARDIAFVEGPNVTLNVYYDGPNERLVVQVAAAGSTAPAPQAAASSFTGLTGNATVSSIGGNGNLIFACCLYKDEGVGFLPHSGVGLAVGSGSRQIAKHTDRGGGGTSGDIYLGRFVARATEHMTINSWVDPLEIVRTGGTSPWTLYVVVHGE